MKYCIKPLISYNKNTQIIHGYLLGLLAVFLFSITVPATKYAIGELPPFFLSSGRTIIAALIAICYLLFNKVRVPNKLLLLQLFFVGLCVAVAFPICITIAMQSTNASHGGIVLGILPLTTAIVSAIFIRHKLSIWFWIFSFIGSVIVVTFCIINSQGNVSIADGVLFIAVISASLGYVLGAKLSKILSSIEVISWALVLVLPIIIPIAIYKLPSIEIIKNASIGSWLCFMYMAIISQYLGFLPWYKGLSMGGVAQVGQLQLLQPFFTVMISALLLGEIISNVTIIVLFVVMFVVFLGKKFSIPSQSMQKIV